MKLLLFLMVAAVVVCSAASADATNLNIVGPDVKEGRLQAELRSGVDFEDEENNETIRQRLHVQYGFTNWFSARLVSSQVRKDSSDWEYKATQIEAKFQLFEHDGDGFAGALRFDYMLGDGDDKPDRVSALWAAEYKAEPFTLRYNVILRHDVGGEQT